MATLNRYAQYSREDVHALFSPETKFTPQAGTWGISGIISLTERNYVFFVTYGQKQGDHIFEEEIDEAGYFLWQSQPRMGFHSPAIAHFINHDASVHQIYLFLRTQKKGPYTYLGQLEYVRHDPEREKPVHFRWKIIDWDAQKAKAALPNLAIVSAGRSLPFSVNSFTWLSEQVLIKQISRSDVLDQGIEMPAEVLPFWQRSPSYREQNEVQVGHLNQLYTLRFREISGRKTRVSWGTDFSLLIRGSFPILFDSGAKNNLTPDEMPEMRFSKEGNAYHLDFLAHTGDEDPASDGGDAQVNLPLFHEGSAYDYTGVRYERDPRNRRAAIRIHGVSCAACGFNFEERYGSHGLGFIEVHHITPLHMMQEERQVNPETDLVPLCPNCHRMVHRNRAKELTLNELRQLLHKA